MPRTLFIALDGPKGTGKTTLLEAIAHALRAGNRAVVRLSERNHDPDRAGTMALVNQLARQPCQALEWQVCQRLAASRGWISQHVLPQQPPGCIILIDRWYPSDAAFRRLVPFAEVLQLNLAQGVRVPDLHVGVVTAPEVSWARAAARGRGLGSTVLRDLAAQAACTEAFERAAAEQGWVVCRNEGTVEQATRQVVAEIAKVMG
ncbi:dTMP kinase [Pseudomonas sp. NPDC007930]|uniref:dTMP kinase n=1 Tax=Pseudomonas sp. NPDC007930 TaxID=3364417 RepID=UPI0036EDE25E